MKKIASLLIAVAIAAVASSNFQHVATKHSHKDPRLCKVFQQKIIDYQKNMRNDAYAKATLASYKERAALFCGN